MEIERRVYEPSRREPESTFKTAAARGMALVACGADQEVLGFCFGEPLEHHLHVDGPKQDPSAGHDECLYSLDLTVAPQARGRGLGRALKLAQLRWAKNRGYRFVSGRNKVGATATMMSVNASLGAYIQGRYTGQYGGEGEALYYKIPLAAPAAQEPANPTSRRLIDLASGIHNPIAFTNDLLAARELVGPLASKLNLSNYATLDTAAYLCELRTRMPRGMTHMYITSSRDEMIDKALRCLRLTRPEAQIAVGMHGGFVGQITAAARSLSDPRGFAPGFGLFPWPRVPHPQDGTVSQTLNALQGVVDEHGAKALFAVVVELIGERSGKVLTEDAAVAVSTWCQRARCTVCCC